MPTYDEKTTTHLEGLWNRMKDMAGGMAGVYGQGYNTKPLNEHEELMLWNKRALSLDQEWALWRQGRTPETQGQPILTPEEIGLKVFPEREKLAKSGGRVEPKDWHAYIKKMADKSEAQFQATREPPDMTGAPTMTEAPSAEPLSLPAPSEVM